MSELLIVPTSVDHARRRRGGTFGIFEVARRTFWILAPGA
jgi:hypothetical protein